ncbi:hypothetical protein [Dyella sp. Tek66A03]|uniref:hypothetical protein n=1 Tax=Dyella sp. Tek66A03 TaxID=3458298 RepID=UPI00403E6944
MSDDTMLDVFALLTIGSALMMWRVAKNLRRVDPSYFRTFDGKLHWWDFGAHLRVLGMLFDPRLPKPAHGPKVRRDIIAIRVLYALSVAGGVYFLYLTFPEIAKSRAH